MESSLRSIIDQSSSVLILLPVKPYLDQVAAGLALYLSLRETKNVSITSPSPMTVELNRLVGVDKISSELGSKNLVISFTGYKADDIEKVSWDIDNEQFRLTVVPKPGVVAPKKEQAKLSYSGVSGDTVILVGGINESHFPAINSQDLAGAKLVHVGTRQLTSSTDKNVISLATPGSTVSEIMASLIKEIGADINSDMATNLLMGIEQGTNKFSAGNITAETFQLVAELMRAGGRRLGRTPPKESFPPGAIPGKIPTQPIQETKPQKTPKDWLEPKIYKGTSVS